MWVSEEQYKWLNEDPLMVMAYQPKQVSSEIESRSTFSRIVSASLLALRASVKHLWRSFDAENNGAFFFAFTLNQESALIDLYHRYPGKKRFVTFDEVPVTPCALFFSVTSALCLAISSSLFRQHVLRFPKVAIGSLVYHYSIKTFLYKCRPKFAFVSSASSFHVKTVLSIGRALGAKSIYVPHALIPNFNIHAFSLVDLIFVGNEIEKKIVKGMTGRDDNIFVCGHLTISTNANPKKKYSSKSPSGVVALFATNDYFDPAIHEGDLENAVSESAHVILRFHPAENQKKYDILLEKYPQLEISKGTSLQEDLQRVSVVYSCYSSVLYEALLNGNRVVQIGAEIVRDPYEMKSILSGKNSFDEDYRTKEEKLGVYMCVLNDFFKLNLFSSR